MTSLDDDDLTNSNVQFGASGRILLLACGAIAREVLAIIDANNWQHIDLQCLPAIFHNDPGKITPAIVDCVEKNRANYDQIFILYADCGTGGQLLEKCKELGVEMLSGPHCYSFFEGNSLFEKRSEDEFTAFYLTDFLVRQFDAFVWQPLGLDRFPNLRDMYFGNYEKLVYQAQTDDPALTKKAMECATRLGLRFERRLTGYGDLQGDLEGFIDGNVSN